MGKITGMSITSLTINARQKVEGACALAAINSYIDAIYLAGYSVELLLKAIVCKANSFPLYPDNDKKYKTHRCDKLVVLASIDKMMKKKLAQDPQFFVNWSLVTEWSTELRYKLPSNNAKQDWEDFYAALMDAEKGVFTWLMTLL